MKLRTGFVSNSSSSSYIVASKEHLTVEKMLEIFGVNENVLNERLFNYIDEIFEYFVSSLDLYQSVEEMSNDLGYDPEDLPKDVPDGWKFYYGNFLWYNDGEGDHDGEITNILGNFKDEELKILEW